MFLALSYSCLCPIHWSQVLSWACSWSSTDRRCSRQVLLSDQQDYSLPTKVYLVLEDWQYTIVEIKVLLMLQIETYLLLMWKLCHNRNCMIFVILSWEYMVRIFPLAQLSPNTHHYTYLLWLEGIFIPLWAAICVGGHLVQTLQNAYLWKRWRDFFCLKYCGIDSTCCCVMSWSFAHIAHMGLPRGPILVKSGISGVRLHQILNPETAG